jgi:hypothetical protein
MRKTAKVGLQTVAAVVALGVAIIPGAAYAQSTTSPGSSPPSQSDQKPSQGDQNSMPGGTGMQGDTTNPDLTASQSQMTNGTFTIKKIDKNSRMITATDEQGTTHVVKAGPDISLDKLKVGQSFDISYYQEVALAIQKPGQATPKVSQTSVQRNGVTATQKTVTEKIVSVDTVGDTVTLQTPSGNKHTIKVSDPSLQQQLNGIKAGDNVQLTFTQALAISATPSSSNSPSQGPSNPSSAPSNPSQSPSTVPSTK